MDDLLSVTSKKHDFISLKICNGGSKYDYLLVYPQKVTSRRFINKNKANLIDNLHDLSCGDCPKPKTITSISANGILAHYFVQELKLSRFYRLSFIKLISTFPSNRIVIKLTPSDQQIIDYSWNEKTMHLVRERVELDHALSWLSTLGGAFSALGDYFPNCAVTAGKISYQQLQLALRLGDPTIAARCKLYFSLSLIQRKYLKLARYIIQKEYNLAKNAIVVDTRLIKMCLGIWAKLKYEYKRKNVQTVKKIL